jgi:hypothetical protein
MHRRFLLLLAAVTFAAASLAVGQTYTGSVLYTLATPSGFAGASYEGDIGFDNVSANQIVGFGYFGNPNSNEDHTLLWTAAGAVDLNPTNLSGFDYSSASGTSGTQQVGYGEASSGVKGTVFTHALLWTGTAASAIDLNPTNLGINSSTANGTNGAQQVGAGYGSFSGSHALLWIGTAASAVDLNPSGYTDSGAVGTDGTQQVGSATDSANNNTHAMLWTGTAASAVDLNPTILSGITTSAASCQRQPTSGIRLWYWNGRRRPRPAMDRHSR